MAVAIEASRLRKKTFDHTLLVGLEGFGKATLSRTLAGELGVAYECRSSSALKRECDLLGVLINLQPGQLLYVEQIDQLRPDIGEMLACAANEFIIKIPRGGRPGAPLATMPLGKFSLIAGSSGSIPKGRLRECFGLVLSFQPYTIEELKTLLLGSTAKSDIQLHTDAAELIAIASAGDPRTARQLLRRCSDFALVEGNGQLTSAIAKRALEMVQVGRTTLSTQTEARQLEMKLSADFTKMNGNEFEEWAATLFRTLGYQVERTSASGDHGIDLLLLKDASRHVVQCKRWTDAVGEPVVRDFYGSLLHSRAQSGFILTTSFFTSQALAFASGKPISLLGRTDLLALMSRLDDHPNEMGVQQIRLF